MTAWLPLCAGRNISILHRKLKRCKPNLNGNIFQQEVAREYQAMKTAAKSNHDTLLCYDNTTVSCVINVIFSSRLEFFNFLTATSSGVIHVPSSMRFFIIFFIL